MPVITDIKKILSQKDYIKFSEFMAISQHSASGYYPNTQAIGKKGDFITAHNFGPLFSWVMAFYVQQLNLAEPYYLTEIGAGTGAFCIHFLKAAQALNCLPKAYFIKEISPTLQQTQTQKIHTQLPELKHLVRYDAPSDLSSSPCVVVANEVLDCLPFDWIEKKQDQWQEKVVTLSKGQLAWANAPIDQNMRTYLAHYVPEDLCEGYEAQICLAYHDFFHNLLNTARQLFVFANDYGYEAPEYFHPQRTEGTVCCFERHKKHQNPFCNIGQQDITAHVQFDALYDAATKQDYTLSFYKTQSQFVIESGILEWMQQIDSKRPVYKALQNNLHALTDPAQMGNVFKCILFEHSD